MKLVNWIRSYWGSHGTKIIGFVTAAIATLEFVDQATINVIVTTLGPKWGPVVSHVILIASGLLTARRGFHNGAKIAQASP
jgi:hypothetical protein